MVRKHQNRKHKDAETSKKAISTSEPKQNRKNRKRKVQLIETEQIEIDLTFDGGATTVLVWRG